MNPELYNYWALVLSGVGVGVTLALGVTTIVIIWKTLKVYRDLLVEAGQTREEALKARQDQETPVLCLRFRLTKDGSGEEYCDHRIMNIGRGPAFITRLYVKSPATNLQGEAKFRDGKDITREVDNVVGTDPIYGCVGGIFGDKTGQFLRDRGTEYELEYVDVFGREYRSSMKDLRQKFETLHGQSRS